MVTQQPYPEAQFNYANEGVTLDASGPSFWSSPASAAGYWGGNLLTDPNNRSSISPMMPGHSNYDIWRRHNPELLEGVTDKARQSGMYLEKIFRDALANKDISYAGMPRKGQEMWFDAAHAYNQYMEDHADDAVRARTPEQKAALSEGALNHIKELGLIPTMGPAGVGKGVLGLSPEHAGWYDEFKDTYWEGDTWGGGHVRDQIMQGGRDAALANEDFYVDHTTPIVRDQYIKNRFGQLGDFYTGLLKNLGSGTSYTLARLLQKVSPGLQKLIAGLARINSDEGGGKDDTA